MSRQIIEITFRETPSSRTSRGNTWMAIQIGEQIYAPVSRLVPSVNRSNTWLRFNDTASIIRNYPIYVPCTKSELTSDNMPILKVEGGGIYIEDALTIDDEGHIAQTGGYLGTVTQELEWGITAYVNHVINNVEYPWYFDETDTAKYTFPALGIVSSPYNGGLILSNVKIPTVYKSSEYSYGVIPTGGIARRNISTHPDVDTMYETDMWGRSSNRHGYFHGRIPHAWCCVGKRIPVWDETYIECATVKLNYFGADFKRACDEV